MPLQDKFRAGEADPCWKVAKRLRRLGMGRNIYLFRYRKVKEGFYDLQGWGSGGGTRQECWVQWSEAVSRTAGRSQTAFSIHLQWKDHQALASSLASQNEDCISQPSLQLGVAHDDAPKGCVLPPDLFLLHDMPRLWMMSWAFWQ